MGKKYTIELERGETAYKTVDSNGTPMIQLLAPTPYTEPDLEQVRKEAYEQGYKKCLSEHDFDSPCVSCDEYKRGLNDAWEAARKIVDLWRDIPNDELMKIFDVRGNWGESVLSLIMRCLPPSEAIEKIRQYEQEKEEIKVGDEVEDGVANLIVLEINQDGTVSGFDDEGSIIHATPRKKTGRHFPEIAEVMQKMKKS